MSTQFEDLQEEHAAQGELIGTLQKIIRIQEGQWAEMQKLHTLEVDKVRCELARLRRVDVAAQQPFSWLVFIGGSWTRKQLRQIWPFNLIWR